VGNLPNAGATHVFVDGIVASGSKEPFVRLMVNGESAQLTIAEAFKVANDLIKTAARIEADAMIFSFFSDNKFPPQAAVALVQDFRYFRQRQDEKIVEAMVRDPDSGETIR
jgi:homoserine acetyltransferase